MSKLAFYIPAVFCLIVQTAEAQTVPVSEDILVPVTSRYTVSKRAKHHTYRLQINPGYNSFSMHGFGFSRLPRTLRTIRFNNGEVTKKKDLHTLVSRSLDSVYTFLQDPQQKLSYTLPIIKEYQRQKNSFLSGRKASPYFSSQWISITRFRLDSPITNLSFRTRGVFKTHHSYSVDLLPGAMAWAFPALDPWNCEPADLKFFRLRKLQGYGVSKIKYVAYDAVARVNIRSSFDVYFPHNQTTPDQTGLSKIVSYLEQNDYAILKAELEGGCSIEGSAERNLFLQQQRAVVLQQALHRYSDNLVRKDTVTLADATQQFRILIKNTPFKWLDTLDNSNLQEKINQDEELRSTLESVFILQRKASLKLVVAKRLTWDEQFQKFLNTLHRTTNQLYGNKTVKPLAEQKALGLLEKLFTYYENGQINKEGLQKIIDETSYPDYLQVLLGYHLLKYFEDHTFPRDKAGAWEQYWTLFEVEHWLMMAQKSLLQLSIRALDRLDRLKYHRMLIDYQAYTYQFVEMELMDINVLCDIPYPSVPEYTGLILNQYAFLYEMSRQKNRFVQCVPENTVVRYRKDSVTDTNEFLEQLQTKHANTAQYDLNGTRLIRQKNFDTTPKGPYYYILKQHYLKNNRNALHYVEYENDPGQVQLNVFNLWHLVSANVEKWDPFENYFYDEDIQVEEMDQLIKQLQKSDKIICKPQVNGLYLTYHLKVLYYLERYYQPGNAKHVRFADVSLKYIMNYYKSRAKEINPRLSLHLARQLNLFNWLPGANAGAFYGYQIMNAIAAIRMLSDDEMKLYAHYLKIYNPQMAKVPAVRYERDKLIALSNETF